MGIQIDKKKKMGEKNIEKIRENDIIQLKK